MDILEIKNVAYSYANSKEKVFSPLKKITNPIFLPRQPPHHTSGCLIM